MLSRFDQKLVFASTLAGSTIVCFLIFMIPLLAIVDFSAYAQSIDAVPPGSTGVDFTPLADKIIAAAVVVLTAVAAFVSRYGVRFLASRAGVQDTQFEALMSERVNDILMRSIDYATGWAKQQIADPRSPIKNVEIDNFFLEQAARYAMRSMPDTLRYFNLSEERIKELLLARLAPLMETPETDGGKNPALA